MYKSRLLLPSLHLPPLPLKFLIKMAKTVTENNDGAANSSTGNSYSNPKAAAKRSLESDDSTTTTYKKPKLQERTDFSKWRLLDEAGRQTWHYLEDDEEAKEWPQSTADKYFLGLPFVYTTPSMCCVMSANLSRTSPISQKPKRLSIQ